MANLLESVTVQSKTGEKLSLANAKSCAKVVLLYFSAHWCPPCRKFTPLLREFYEEINDENKQVEIVFVSSDNTVEEHDKYFNEAHGNWWTVPFEAETLREQLRAEFGKKLNSEGELVRSGIPSVVALSTDLSEVVSYDGVADITTLGSMALEMKWTM